ncbi:hypothetical protein BV25DRAFT_722849 [Artomyces pyxidatus]|uniref:Uncharacterized protein n=1 Tax=Artomyces pyxidatus TaxID=48021 RepID=A0ACB8T0F5_9AGAM|nr:hypothetical protein BV25DRAFT_722849 [Artomyces pyxidatus]
MHTSKLAKKRLIPKVRKPLPQPEGPSSDPPENTPILPYDLYIIILETVYRLSQSREVDYNTLFAASLVCRSWRLIAQRLYFRRLGGPITTSSATPFIRMTLKNPILGSYILSLTVTFQAMAHDTFIAVLRRCPSLVKLTVSSNHMRDFSADELARIDSLNLQVVVLDCKFVCSAVLQLASLWPTLRYFHHGTDVFLGKPRYNLRGKTAPFALESFQWDERISADRASYLSWLLPAGPAARLRAIHLGTYYDRDYDFLIPYAQTIRSFTGPSFPPERLLMLMPRLEELVVGELPRTSHEMPSTLRHVAFHPVRCPNQHSYNHFRHLLSAHRSIELVSVTLDSDAQLLSSVEEICREHGVELITFKDPWSFPVCTTDGLVSRQNRLNHFVSVLNTLIGWVRTCITTSYGLHVDSGV